MWLAGFIVVLAAYTAYCIFTAPDEDETDYQRILDYCEQPFVPTDSDEPRCDITGQPLTIEQRFNQECG